MTDKQRAALLNVAVRELQQTDRGFTPSGIHWRNAMAALALLDDDLDPPKVAVPLLGPIFKGGASVLMHDLTHRTAGISLYPAFDDAFDRQGLAIIAPENMEVWKRKTSSNPGHAMYLKGESKIDVWVGHLDRDHPLGTQFRRGEMIGKIGPNVLSQPHVHWAVNVERLLGKGKQLIHHTNYTHGAPTIGKQLAVLMA